MLWCGRETAALLRLDENKDVGARYYRMNIKERGGGLSATAPARLRGKETGRAGVLHLHP